MIKRRDPLVYYECNKLRLIPWKVLLCSSRVQCSTHVMLLESKRRLGDSRLPLNSAKPDLVNISAAKRTGAVSGGQREDTMYPQPTPHNSGPRALREQAPILTVARPGRSSRSLSPQGLLRHPTWTAHWLQLPYTTTASRLYNDDDRVHD